MRQRQEVQEVLPPVRIFPALPTESAVRKLPYRPARSAAPQIHGPHDAYNSTSKNRTLQQNPMCVASHVRSLDWGNLREAGQQGSQSWEYMSLAYYWYEA